MSGSGKMQELRTSSSRAVTTPRSKGMRGEKLPEGERHVGFLESSDFRLMDRISPKRELSRIKIWTLLSSYPLIFLNSLYFEPN